MLSWAKSDNPSSEGSLGEWIYRTRVSPKTIVAEKTSDVTITENLNNDTNEPVTKDETSIEETKASLSMDRYRLNRQKNKSPVVEYL